MKTFTNKETVIFPHTNIEDRLAFAIIDNPGLGEGSTWTQFELGLSLDCSYGTIRFNTSPEHLRKLATRLLEAAEKVEVFYKDA